MTNRTKRKPPPGYSYELWKNMRHDLAQCVHSMENIANLLEKNFMPIDLAVIELKKLSKQAGHIFTILFEESEASLPKK